MSPRIVTTVDVNVPTEREQELVAGYRHLSEAARPDGFVRSELLRGQEGQWRIQTTWRDMESLVALRRTGQPPAVLALLDQLGVVHSHSVFSVEESRES